MANVVKDYEKIGKRNKKKDDEEDGNKTEGQAVTA